MSQRVIWGFFVIIDTIIASFVPILALYIRFDGEIPPQYMQTLANYFPSVIVVFIGTFYFFRLYHRILRYVGIHEVLLPIYNVRQ